MNRNDGFDWLDEVQRRRHEPSPGFKTLLVEALLWAAAIIGLGYTLRHIA